MRVWNRSLNVCFVLCMRCVWALPPYAEVRADTALYNLINHYRTRTDVSFVEHFLTLGFAFSPSNLEHLQATGAHNRLTFMQYLDRDRDGEVSDADIVARYCRPAWFACLPRGGRSSPLCGYIVCMFHVHDKTCVCVRSACY